MKNLLVKLSLIGLIAYAVSPMTANAAPQITNRSVTLTNSAGAPGTQTSTYTTTFTLGTSGQTLGSIKLEICDSPVSAASCLNSGNSAGATFTGSTFGSVTCATCNGGSWSLGSASGNTAYVTHSVAGVTGTPAVTIVMNGVTNPSANNKEFYIRISTYSDTIATTPAYPGTDYGAVAVSTSQAITVSGTMPESLVFCVGTVWTSDCTNISGSAVDLGTFSPTFTNFGTSVMSASTNASSGYAITVNGTVPTSGANSIAAMGTQSANSAGCSPSCTATTGVSQFGSNVRLNTAPVVGSNVSGAGSATGSGGYNTADSFRFFTGDTVASVGTQTNSNLFTNSYIVNVGGSQAAGLYTATMTYICTATF